jgi:pSer/pThr/pTyr-binding forkhead associated (FHA) protein
MYALKISIMSGPEDGKTLWLKSNQQKGRALQNGWAFVLGRREDCDLSFPFDVQVSREHAFLHVLENELLLVDANSRNGTYLGGLRLVQPTPLQTLQLFRVGHTWLRVDEVRR